jgi:hypothetical protein
VHFSADGKHYAAQCEIQNVKGHSLVVDGKKGQEYDFIEQFGFTPDSSKVVYVARTGRQVFLVTGEQESEGTVASPACGTARAVSASPTRSRR